MGTYCNKNPARGKEGEMITIAQNISKATWKSNIWKTNPQNYLTKRSNDSRMLATMRDDTWNVLNIQHINPILKDGIQTSLVVALEKIKGPTQK